MSEQNRNYEQIEEITLHFGKGTVEPFTAKDGREMLKIMIPNADRSDHTPWASFVLPAKAVHENQYGKGLWAKIPADGHTTLTKPYLAGQSEDGKNIWKDEKATISNRELKSMVEFYKRIWFRNTIFRSFDPAGSTCCPIHRYNDRILPEIRVKTSLHLAAFFI